MNSLQAAFLHGYMDKTAGEPEQSLEEQYFDLIGKNMPRNLADRKRVDILARRADRLMDEARADYDRKQYGGIDRLWRRLWMLPERPSAYTLPDTEFPQQSRYKKIVRTAPQKAIDARTEKERSLLQRSMERDSVSGVPRSTQVGKHTVFVPKGGSAIAPSIEQEISRALKEKRP